MEIIVFFLPLLIGLGLCLLLAARVGHASVLVWLAPIVGVGISSLFFFVWSLIFYPRFQTPLYLGLKIFLVFVVFARLWVLRAAWLPRVRLPLRPL